MFCGAVAILTTNLVSAQTVQYVSDQLEAPVRSGPDDKNRIVKMLTSGEKVQKLSERGSFVEISFNGTKGWIHKRFLMDDAPAREFVELARSQFEPLKEKIDTLENSVKEKDAVIQRITELNEQLKQAVDKQSTEIAYIEQTYKNAIDIDRKNQELEQLRVQNESRIDQLEKEVTTLSERKRSDEWLKGAGILFGGILLGTSILPRLLRYRNQKKSWGRR